VSPRRLPLLTIEPDPKLTAYEAAEPAWLRWLDDKSIAAIPPAGGVIIGMDWEDLCAAIVPHLTGSDAEFAKEREDAIPQALTTLEGSLSQALAEVRNRATSSPADDAAPEPMVQVAAAAAECAMRALLARVADRSTAELLPVARALDGLPRLYWNGPAAALANEQAAERVAPRAAAVASIAGYLASTPVGSSSQHGGWMGTQLEQRNWKWFESALVRLTYTASVARLVAAGCAWPGRFSVTYCATRGRVFDANEARK
jgi:hypothetical protein